MDAICTKCLNRFTCKNIQTSGNQNYLCDAARMERQKIQPMQSQAPQMQYSQNRPAQNIPMQNIPQWNASPQYTQNQIMQCQLPNPNQNRQGITCRRCGSNNVISYNESNLQIDHRGCLGWGLWILLACLTLGLILIIPLMTNTKAKANNRTVHICQSCGNRWY